MILSFLSAKSRQTLKSKISNKYLKPFPRNYTLKSVALAVALSVYINPEQLYVINSFKEIFIFVC